MGVSKEDAWKDFFQDLISSASCWFVSNTSYLVFIYSLIALLKNKGNPQDTK
jgi:hypothetical protein